MSMYMCKICNELKDNDYDVCHEHPTDPLELVCDDCHNSVYCDECEGVLPEPMWSNGGTCEGCEPYH